MPEPWVLWLGVTMGMQAHIAWNARGVNRVLRYVVELQDRGLLAESAIALAIAMGEQQVQKQRLELAGTALGIFWGIVLV